MKIQKAQGEKKDSQQAVPKERWQEGHQQAVVREREGLSYRASCA